MKGPRQAACRDARPGTPPRLENLSGARPTPRGDRRGSSAARTENRSKMQGCRMNSHSVTVHSESTRRRPTFLLSREVGFVTHLPARRRGALRHFRRSHQLGQSDFNALAACASAREQAKHFPFRFPHYRRWLSLRTGYTASLPPSKYSRFRRSYRCGLRAPPLYVSQLTVVTAAAAIVDGARKRDT